MSVRDRQPEFLQPPQQVAGLADFLYLGSPSAEANHDRLGRERGGDAKPHGQGQ